ITDRAFVESEKGEDIAAARFGDGVEGVGGCGGARHAETIHSHMGICQAKNFGVFKTIETSNLQGRREGRSCAPGPNARKPRAWQELEPASRREPAIC